MTICLGGMVNDGDGYGLWDGCGMVMGCDCGQLAIFFKLMDLHASPCPNGIDISGEEAQKCLGARTTSSQGAQGGQGEYPRRDPILIANDQRKFSGRNFRVTDF